MHIPSKNSSILDTRNVWCGLKRMNSVKCVSKALKSFNPHPQTSASFLISSGFCLHTNWSETTVPPLRESQETWCAVIISHHQGITIPFGAPLYLRNYQTVKGKWTKQVGWCQWNCKKEQQKCRKISEDHDWTPSTKWSLECDLVTTTSTSRLRLLSSVFIHHYELTNNLKHHQQNLSSKPGRSNKKNPPNWTDRFLYIKTPPGKPSALFLRQ